jgi:SAM-dependent methyltransferase
MSSQQLQDRNVAWFTERPDDSQLSLDARHLLESYSGISADDVVEHVIKLRNEAWRVFPYPCIGQFRFLDLSLKQTKEYPELLERLGQGQRLLDMACCFGQEIRQLVADGAPSEQIYGCDLRKEYVELGYQLFRDRDRLHSPFLTADIFDNSSPLIELQGTFDVVYAGSFFHLFGYENQVKVSTAVAKLLRPRKGSMILGRQIGAVDAGTHDHKTNPTGKMYRHNPESLREMWKKIGADLGVSFSVDATLHELAGDHFRFHTDDTRRIHFTIKRE